MAERASLYGLPLSIELHVGEVRRGKDPAGKPWSVVMPCHYGDIEGTTSADGEPLDVLVNPAPAPVNDVLVFAFRVRDEPKVMIGWAHPEDARQIAQRVYPAMKLAEWKVYYPHEFRGWLSTFQHPAADPTRPKTLVRLVMRSGGVRPSPR